MVSWNPWHGCRRYSEGCLHCYMYYLDAQRGMDGSHIFRVKNHFDLPQKKDRQGRYKIPPGSVLATCMTSDFFLEQADAWREEAWDLIRSRPDVCFFIITKRITRVAQCLPSDWGAGWKNVQINVTVENQKRADERLPIFASLPFYYRGIVMAPLLEPVHIEDYLKSGAFHGVSVGGENYTGARPCHYEWVVDICEQCQRADVTFEFYDTGHHFYKDGRYYCIPKSMGREQAKRSGLGYRSKRAMPEPVLCFPEENEQIGIFDTLSESE